jgi:alanyl aminopeptidase
VRRVAVLIVIACACSGERAASPGRDGRDRGVVDVDDPTGEIVAPGLRLPAGVEPLGYRIALDVDPAAPTFRGRVEIKLVLAEARDHVWLHAVDLDIGSIEVEAGGQVRPGMIAPVDGDEMIAIDLGGVVAKGLLTLRIDYVGEYHDQDQVGLFRAEVAGKQYVYSQLEAVHARKVVPCLDEPQFKVPWLVTLDIPPGVIAAGNAPIADVADHGADGQIVHFAPTEPLPSYLVALAVGPFVTFELGRVGINKLPLRVIAPAGTTAAEASYVRAATPKIVDRLEAYFARPMPYAKLDLVAIPSFPGAMENAGLITFDADLLLVGTRPAARTGFVELAAHELAHQWFGNLVTLAWWDDLWLNESFATWMADKISAELAPGRDDATATHDDLEVAMAADATPTAAALRRDIRTNGDIEGSFDAIAYHKGAAVIAMFEAWMGEDRLRDAIRAWVAKHANGISDSAGFLDAVEAASDAGVRAAFASFVDQPGVPLIELDRRCDGGVTRIGVTQRRFLPIGSATPTARWQVPICVRYPGAAGKTVRGCVILAGASAEIAAPDVPCPGWIVANAEDRGYYRTRIDPALAPPIGALTPRERLGLVGGIAALIDGGLGDPAAITGIVPKLIATGQPRDDSAAIDLVRATRSLVADARVAAWQRWARTLLAPVVARTRVGEKPSGDAARRIARIERIELAGYLLDDPSVIADARVRVSKWLDGKLALAGDELAALAGVAAHGADRAFADRLLARAATMTAGADRAAVLGALGEIVDLEAVQAALAAVVDPAFPTAQDVEGVIAGLASRAPTRALLLALYRDRRAAIVAKLPALLAPETLIGPFAAVCDAAEKQTVVDQLTPLAKDLEGGELELVDTVAEIDRCIARRAALGPALERILGP